MRIKPHYLFNGPSKKEGQICLVTRSCSWGDCTFCPLKNVDAPFDKLGPLTEKEMLSQVYIPNEWVKKRKERIALKITSESLLSKRICSIYALLRAVHSIFLHLPSLRQIGIETRPDELMKHEKEARIFAGFCWRMGVEPFFAIGVETTDEQLRKDIGKGISNITLRACADLIKEIDAGLRFYFIYGLSEAMRWGEEDIRQMIAFTKEMARSLSSRCFLETYVNLLFGMLDRKENLSLLAKLEEERRKALELAKKVGIGLTIDLAEANAKICEKELKKE